LTQPPPFVLFGSDHLAALVVAVAGAALATTFARRASLETGRFLRRALALALLTLASLDVAVSAGEAAVPWERLLPFQLCDANVVLAVVALLTLNRRAAAILYFWALAGTLPGMITPELPAGFPGFRFLAYFSIHGLVIASAVTLTFGFRCLPDRLDFVRAFLALNLYAAAIAVVNERLDANFLYLLRKPASPTLLDLLGPWPYYLLVLEALFLAVFLLLDLPLRKLRGASAAWRAPRD
jgi:hypothetical integral membrane protein (TIGR02206 family)